MPLIGRDFRRSRRITPHKCACVSGSPPSTCRIVAISETGLLVILGKRRGCFVERPWGPNPSENAYVSANGAVPLDRRRRPRRTVAASKALVFRTKERPRRTRRSGCLPHGLLGSCGAAKALGHPPCDLITLSIFLARLRAAVKEARIRRYSSISFWRRASPPAGTSHPSRDPPAPLKTNTQRQSVSRNPTVAMLYLG